LYLYPLVALEQIRVVIAPRTGQQPAAGSGKQSRPSAELHRKIQSGAVSIGSFSTSPQSHGARKQQKTDGQKQKVQPAEKIEEIHDGTRIQKKRGVRRPDPVCF
jgi:hypothetical protein